MRRRSFTGPLMLLLIGGLFLWRNLNPDVPVFELFSRYWPFLLIGWGVLRLAEVLVWRKQRLSSFSGGEVVLVVLICIAGSLMWEVKQRGVHWPGRGGLEFFGEEYDYQVSASASAKGMTRVAFENPRGNIKIIGGDVQDVTVNGRKLVRAWGRKEADSTNEKTPVEIVPQGDRLLIRTNQDRAPENQRVSDDLEVTVPRGVAIEARGRTGDYEVTDIAGDVELMIDRADVRLARVGGNVRLEIGRSELIRAASITGKIDVQGRGSDLDMESISGQVTINGTFTGTQQFKALAKPLQFEGARNTELRVQAVPGRLIMDLSEVSGSGLTGPVRVVARSRDVKLSGFTHSAEIETERGDITIEPSLPVAQISARSGSGRIDLVLPEKASFDLEATAEKGEAYNGFGAGIQQDRDGRTATLKGKVGDGPTIRLTANRGSVSVRKEGSLPLEAPEGQSDRPGRRMPQDLKGREVKM